VNDTYGHAAGDVVLRELADRMVAAVAGDGTVARWGGEEFCVLLPRIGLAEADALAQRVATQIASAGKPRVTVSIGVAEVHVRSEDPDGVIRRADVALYRAKQAGRNRVVTAASLAPA